MKRTRLSKKKITLLESFAGQCSAIENTALRFLTKLKNRSDLISLLGLDKNVEISEADKKQGFYRFGDAKKNSSSNEYSSYLSRGILKSAQISRIDNYLRLCVEIILMPNADAGYYLKQLPTQLTSRKPKTSYSFIKAQLPKIKDRYNHLADRNTLKPELVNHYPLKSAIILLSSCCLEIAPTAESGSLYDPTILEKYIAEAEALKKDTESVVKKYNRDQRKKRKLKKNTKLPKSVPQKPKT